MTPETLLKTCHTRHIQLQVEQDDIRFRAPAGAMTAEVRQALTEYKAVLLRTLRKRATPCPHARVYRRLNDSPWLAYEWPQTENPLSFPREQQPQHTGASMLVFAPWGELLSSGPVRVLGIRGHGNDRELQWYDVKEDRPRWHVAELCQEYRQEETPS